MSRPQRTIIQEGGAAGMLRTTSVSHIAFRVPDVAAAADFYERVLGLRIHSTLTDGTLRLGWGAGHHVLDLVQGEKGLLHYAFEVRDEGGLDGLRKRLTASGTSFERLDDAVIDDAVGTADGIAVRDPDGNDVQFHSAVRRLGEHAADTGRRPIKFQHTTIGTCDVPRFVDFFVGTVGFRLSDQLQNGHFCWMRSDRDHHTLAVVDVGRGGDIDHYSYDLAEWEDFKAWCDRLTDLDVRVQWGPGRHGPGNNLFVFFDDPAGNHVELSAEMEKFHDDRVEYVPRRWEPKPETVNLWGGQTPSWRNVDSGSHI
jgi:catechol 2,3-dioxygenase-like lactoylglutathione lyase family enzyme